IDHFPACLTMDAAFTQPAFGGHGREPLIEQADRARPEAFGDAVREAARRRGGRPFAARKRRRPAHQPLPRLVLRDKLGEPVDIAPAAAYRLQGRRQNPGGVAARDADADTARIDAQTHALPHPALMLDRARSARAVSGRFNAPSSLVALVAVLNCAR